MGVPRVTAALSHYRRPVGRQVPAAAVCTMHGTAGHPHHRPGLLQTALTWEVGREKHTTIQVVGDGGRCQSTSKHPAPSHKRENAVKRCQLLRLGADPGVIYLSSDLDSITCPTLIPKQPASNGLPSQISSLSLTFFKPFPN